VDREALHLREHRFADGAALADALTRAVVASLRDAIAARGQAILVAPGGNSPRRFLTQLGRQALDWSRVTVTLTDERQVAPDSPRANARLLRETLFQGAAAAARFVPLYASTADGHLDLERVETDVGALRLPFDTIVLGMGTDGHCASLFPAADHLDEALRTDSDARVMPMRAPGAGEPRVTLTLAALVNTRALYLHIEGSEKRGVLDRVVAGAPAPVGTVLRQSSVQPQVYWCP